MSKLTLKVEKNNKIYLYDIQVVPEMVMMGGRMYAGLDISNESYKGIEGLGLNAELPMYAWNEGYDVAGSFEDDDGVKATWAILVDGVQATGVQIDDVIAAT